MQVRKQTRDIASMLKVVTSKYKPQFFLFLEDDMNWCPGIPPSIASHYTPP
jgi:hypothetical protein